MLIIAFLAHSLLTPVEKSWWIINWTLVAYPSSADLSQKAAGRPGFDGRIYLLGTEGILPVDA